MVRLRSHIHHIFTHHLHIVNWHKQKTLVTTESKQESKAKLVLFELGYIQFCMNYISLFKQKSLYRSTGLNRYDRKNWIYTVVLCQACIWAHTIVSLHLQFSLSKDIFISKGLGFLIVCAFLIHNILENISTDIFLSACIPSSSILFYNFICGKG